MHRQKIYKSVYEWMEHIMRATLCIKMFSVPQACTPVAHKKDTTMFAFSGTPSF